MRIPKTAIRTAWRADWLAEFSLALLALAFLAREIIFAAVGAGILLALASLGLIFHRRLGILRRELCVVERVPKARVFLGDSIEGDLTIQNGSRFPARIVAVTPVVGKGLSLRLSPSSSQLLRPGATSSSKFEITSRKSGRFQISGFTLTFTDARGLFTGEVKYGQAEWVVVCPDVRSQTPLTPLRLYMGSPEVFRKAPAGMDYAGIREYIPGDEYHRVEWKATARLGTLMVKEFHPEAQIPLQILIDIGRTMHQQSYVGTRLDEAIAVTRLLTELAIGSGSRVGILIYNETEIVRTIKPTMAEEQLAPLQALAMSLQAQTPTEKTGNLTTPARPWWRRTVDQSWSERAATFRRLLRRKLGLDYRKTGIYKALTEAIRIDQGGFLIILTDLQTHDDGLLEASAIHPEQGRITVAQIGAVWRLSLGLEEAYIEFQRNSRTLRRLQCAGLRVFDLQPEKLVEALSELVRKGIVTIPTDQ